MLDNLLIRPPAQLQLPQRVLPDEAARLRDITTFLNENIVAIRNRLPTIPLTRDVLTRNPQEILPLFKFILRQYEDEHHQEQEPEPAQQRRVLPRLFALFPCPSTKWRFIKVDAPNIHAFFNVVPEKLPDETTIDYTRRLFWHFFDFRKFKIRNWDEFNNLPQTKAKMFMNSMYTDGYTCRLLFARRVENNPLDAIELDISDFDLDEVDDHFRVCTVDPGRRDAFNSYHDDDDVRRLTTKEYYSASGAPQRSKKEDRRKIQTGIKDIETNIPTSKTTSDTAFIHHTRYMLQNLTALFGFYGFETAEIRWNNYRGGQRALDQCCNILINGSPKYNKFKRKRKKTNLNRRKRKRMNNRRNIGISHQSIEPT